MRRQTSRKATPWDGEETMTETQTFLKQLYERHYAERHTPLRDSGEAAVVNSFVPQKCPHCGSVKFKRSGHTNIGIQRYKCVCGKTFLPTTGTIFDEHRISISEWMEYCLNLFHHVSITAGSWNNKNAFATSRYWLQKLFLTLENVQENTVLSDVIWLDETYYSVRSEDMVKNDAGEKLTGISRNQICIAVATDKEKSYLAVAGTGRSTQQKTLELLQSHIAQGSTLIHDGDTAHKLLIDALSLNSVVHTTAETRGLADEDNPLCPINKVHATLKNFLNAHSGFKREDLPGYLNLFALVSNPPVNLLEKVDIVINLAFQYPKLLRFRDFYAANAGIAENK